MELDEAALAVFGVGDHHSLDFMVSAVPVVRRATAKSSTSVDAISASR